MRNLKKVLALVLALVMAMSLVTIANADFTDADEINYKEAVDVMSAIGVIDGLDTGAFNPTGTLTREQAAKIIATMMLGENADKLGTSTSSFKDVAATRWSSPYIEYCASIGIIAGNGDGTYNPTGKLTGHAFAKMLLGALGYDSARENYTGAGWSIEVAKDAVTAGIAVDGVAMSAQLTREQAAQMAFQTLQATTVEYATAGSVITTPDGTTVVTGGSTASKVEAGKNAKDFGGGDSDYVEFCETYFPKLTKASGSEDVQGRPGYDWNFEGKTVAFSSADALATFTSETKESSVKSAIKSAYESDAKISVYKDGKRDGAAKTMTYADIADLTGNGVTVEVYTEKDGDTDVISSIVVVNEYVGKISRVSTNDDDERYVKVDGMDYVTEAYEKGDYVLYTKGNNSDAKDVIVSMSAVETVEGEVTATAKDYIKIDGTTYNFNKNYENTLKAGDDCLVYLDSQGNILEVGEAVATPDDYAYVVAIESSLGDYRAKLVLADGSKVTVDVDDEDGNGDPLSVKNNSYVSYTVDDNVYTLTALKGGSPAGEGDYVTLGGGVKITKGSSKILDSTGTGVRATANSATVFVNADNGKVYTGYKNVPTMTGVTGAAFVEDGVATLVFITSATDGYDSDDTTFFVADKSDWESFKEDKTTYYTLTVYVDGEETTMTFTSSALGDLVNGLNVVKSVNDSEHVTAVDTAKKVALGDMDEYNATVASDDTLVLRAVSGGKTTSYIYDDETLFVKVETDNDGAVNNVYVADASDITLYDTAEDADNTDASYVLVVETDDGNGELTTIVYIVD